MTESRIYAVNLVSIFVLCLVGATPAMTLVNILMISSTILTSLLLFWGKRKFCMTYECIQIFFGFFYIFVVTLLNNVSVVLAIKNGSFILFIFLYGFIGTSKKEIFTKQNARKVLFFLQIFLLVRFLILEKPSFSLGRIILDDYNIADTAVLTVFALSFSMGNWINKLLCLPLLILIGGFGIRANFFVAVIIILHFISLKKYGKIFVALVFGLLTAFILTKLDMQSIFLIEKFTNFGSGYKLFEFKKLLDDLNASAVFFPYGLNHRFNLGVFDGTVYFSHFFIMYIVYVGGIIGVMLLIYLLFIITVACVSALKNIRNSVDQLVFYIILSALPALTIQATYKSLTFGAVVVTVSIYVSAKRRIENNGVSRGFHRKSRPEGACL